MFDRQQSIASLVLEHSECAPILQRHRLDYCCRGQLSLEEACAARGVDSEALVAELTRAIDARRGRPDDDPRALSTKALVDHIVGTHHEYLREALPFVQGLAAKVSRVHGEHNPKLRELDTVVRELATTLLPHLDSEEAELFPALLEEAPELAKLEVELASMREEHLEVAALLERLRNASEDFALPDWACNSYRTLFSELEQLEGDLLTHVHLENHVLQPRFVASGPAAA